MKYALVLVGLISLANVHAGDTPELLGELSKLKNNNLKSKNIREARMNEILTAQIDDQTPWKISVLKQPARNGILVGHKILLMTQEAKVHGVIAARVWVADFVPTDKLNTLEENNRALREGGLSSGSVRNSWSDPSSSLWPNIVKLFDSKWEVITDDREFNNDEIESLKRDIEGARANFHPRAWDGGQNCESWIKSLLNRFDLSLGLEELTDCLRKLFEGTVDTCA